LDIFGPHEKNRYWCSPVPGMSKEASRLLRQECIGLFHAVVGENTNNSCGSSGRKFVIYFSVTFSGKLYCFVVASKKGAVGENINKGMKTVFNCLKNSATWSTSEIEVP